jgi:hypothetical protein
MLFKSSFFASTLGIILCACALPSQAQSSEDLLELPLRRDLASELAPQSLQPAITAPTTHPLRARLPDPLRVRGFSSNRTPFPDSALFDNSDLLHPPAGQFGFLQTTETGDFEFSNGRPVRFWGVTITQEHIDVPRSVIEEVVDTLARAGCNLVRFHSLDNRAGESYGFVRRTIIDENPSDTQHFDPEYLDRLHYWVARLKERGIYSAIVLRAFRHYRDGDLVPAASQLPRGARPHAFFHPRLIALQKEFNRALLFDTINPYTGLALGQDPALAFVELFNEDSLFSRPEAIAQLIPPYDQEFLGLWNDYLRERYPNERALRESWNPQNARSALQSSESWARKNIAFPSLPLSETFQQAQTRSEPLLLPKRRSDAIEFAIQLQRRYFRALAEDLTKAGLLVPITGVVLGSLAQDTFSVVQELDFTAENAYYDHPAYAQGEQWNGRPFFRNTSPLGPPGGNQWIPHASRYHWMDTPHVVREWTIGWPNSHRGSQMLDMAAYGRFQNWDGLLSFAYFTTSDLHRLGTFAIQNDPLRWGLFAYGARLFLQDDYLQPAQHTIALKWNPEDLALWGDSTTPLHELAYQHRIQLMPTLEQTPSSTSPSLTVLLGRNHSPGYQEDQGLIMGTPGLAAPQNSQPNLWQNSGYDLPWPDAPDQTSYQLPGPTLADSETTAHPQARGFSLSRLLALNLTPFAPSPDGKYALGGIDTIRQNLVLGILPPTWTPRVITEHFRLRHESPTTLADYLAGTLRTDTNQIWRDTRKQQLILDTPMVQALAGSFTPFETVSTPSGRLRYQSASPVATITALSLDRLPLETSRRWSLKLITVATNRQARLMPDPTGQHSGMLVLDQEGSAPIVTQGRILENDQLTEIQVPGVLQMTLGLAGGTFELLVDHDQQTAFLSCDLPNTPIELRLENPDTGAVISPMALRPYQHETLTDGPTIPVTTQWRYPGWAKLVTLRWGK